MKLSRLQDHLMPMTCGFCGVRCKQYERFICAGCLTDLPWRSDHCDASVAPLSIVAAPLEYAFPVDAALKALKFRRRLDYVPGLSELLWRVMSDLPEDIDALLPMPLHWRRQAMRGFNQALELSRPLQKRISLPFVHGLRRARSTPFQSGLDADARKRNLRDAFAATEIITAKHVLIVDDVITTGESCRQLAKVLLDAGAEKVSALAVARA